MAAADGVDYSCLMTILDSTWGRSSTPLTATRSVKFQLIDGSHLKATYGSIVNFARERDMLDTKRREAVDADNLVDQLIASAKAQYKELTGRTLRVKQTKGIDDVAIISHSPHNPRRTGKYTRVVVMEIG